jgi:aminoglycoside phosphotransferase
MPRFLANLYSIVASRRPYRTYTHSYRGFKQLFGAAGFPALEFYGLTPGYSGLAEIVPADTAQPCWAPPAPRPWKERLKRSRYFVPAYAIVAGEARAGRASMLERMLDAIATSLNIEPREIRVERLHVSEKDKVVLLLAVSGRSVIVKVPCASNTVTGEENHWSALARLTVIPRVATLAPRPLARQSMQGLTFYVESAVPGRALEAHVTLSNRARWASLIGDFLTHLNPGLERSPKRPLDAAAFEALVARPIKRLRYALVDQADYDMALRYFRDRLVNVPMRLGLTHGDLTQHNVFGENGSVSGVIDWEHANERGLPALDAISYVESIQRLLSPGSGIRDTLGDLAALKWASEAELALLRRAYEASGIDPGLHPVLCHLNWLHHVAHQLDTTFRFAPSYFGDRVRPLLARLAAA